MSKRSIVLLAACAVSSFAQRYEFGAHGGISYYNNKTVTNARGNADVGFKTGYAAGITIGHDMYERVSGEIRYSFLHNEMKVSSGSIQAGFNSQAHAVHYDVLIHTSDRSAGVRPYAAIGGGVKHFQGTGAEQAFQPLSNLAILTRTSDTKGLVSVGGGVKVRLNERMGLRFDLHDYLTPFPKKVITPASGSSIGGWVNNIVGTAGVTFTF